MRALFVTLHRWAGLFIALFLFVAGLSGAIISWDHELDEWLNPQLFEARSGAHARPLAPLQLARQLESADTRLRVSYLPLSIEPGHSLGVAVVPRLNPATGRRFDLGFNQMALDPATGVVQGHRQWGEVSLSRANLLPFLYKLHYSLHIPDIRHAPVGMWVMGIVSLVWILDCFIALWIAFPNPRTWHKSFAFRLRHGGPRLVFDLHRSGGAWLWAVLLMLAVTSVSMNLGREVMKPVVSLFSPVSATPFETRTPAPPETSIEPVVSREAALAVAQAEAARRGWRAPAGGIFHADRVDLYGVVFFEPGAAHADGRLGNPWLYIDAATGALVGEHVPGSGSAGDIFLQAQFALHSGRILGLPGRILMSFMGLAVALFSATGVLLWARKRRALAVRNRAAQTR